MAANCCTRCSTSASIYEVATARGDSAGEETTGRDATDSKVRSSSTSSPSLVGRCFGCCGVVDQNTNVLRNNFLTWSVNMAQSSKKGEGNGPQLRQVSRSQAAKPAVGGKRLAQPANAGAEKDF